MYNLFDYGLMIADRRIGLYAEALRRTIRPGDVVVDLGAGPGIWAMLACQLGARRVYAIEPNPVVGLAQELSRTNGFSDRIVCIAEASTEVTLPEPADIVVSDLRGVASSLFEGGLATLIDARRFLSSTGALIPRRDELFAAIVSAPAEYEAYVGPWEPGPFGFNYGLARQRAVNTWRKVKPPFAATQLLSAGEAWGAIDFRTVESTSLSGRVVLEAHEHGRAHGLAIWFDTELIPGVRFSNSPAAEPLIYTQGFMPWPRPLDLRAGDRIAVELGAHVVNGRYVWRWRSEVLGRDAASATSFDQSTWYGESLVPSRIRRFASDATVHISEEGRAVRQVLDMLLAGRTLEETASALAEGWSARFPTFTDGLRFAEAIATGYAAADHER